MTVVTLGLPTVVPAAGGPAPATGPLIDTYGRAATDLRVSLTDRCNLRCTYCMPADGLKWLPKLDLLTADELVRVIGIAVTRLGITSVRFTGGEPLVAPNLDEVVAATAALEPRPGIAMTTNGIGLAGRAADLARAGLDRVNVSLDTLDRTRFAEITRRDRLGDVLAGLAAAREAGLNPIKVNAVLHPDGGLADAVDLLRFCVREGYQLRIIEQMPLDAGHQWSRGAMITADQVLAALGEHVTLAPDPEHRGSAPAQLWTVDGGPHKVGVIASVTRPFCGDCDRTRLTADGQVRNCLFSRQETDLRGLLRSGADDEAVDDAIEAAWRDAMWAKAAGHGINDPGFVQPGRPMSAIGG
jgi:GTP 3',8-cyclase